MGGRDRFRPIIACLAACLVFVASVATAAEAGSGSPLGGATATASAQAGTDQAHPRVLTVADDPQGDAFVESLKGMTIYQHLLDANAFVSSLSTSRAPYSTSVIAVTATSDDIIVMLDKTAYTDQALVGALTADLEGTASRVVWTDPPQLDSAVSYGEGIHLNTAVTLPPASWCSAGFGGSVRSGSYHDWYLVTAGHCDYYANPCGGIKTPLFHDANDWTTNADRHMHSPQWTWGILPAYWPIDSVGPADQAAIYVGTNTSTTPPAGSLTNLVRSDNGAFGHRIIQSFGDTAFFTSGFPLQAFGHTGGWDSPTYFLGITDFVFAPCAGHSITMKYMVTTNTGSAGCYHGDSGGPVYGVYYPFTNLAHVSLLGTHTASAQTAFGEACYYSQPAFAMAGWGMTGYTG